jgi:hypothetical protein
MLFYRGLIVIRRFAVLHCYGAGRAFGKAITQAIAIRFGHKTRLAVYHLYSSFVAGGNAYSASVAFIFINTYYISFHFAQPFLTLLVYYSKMKAINTLHLQRL